MTDTVEEKPVKHLVVDSSVLIRRAPLKDLAETVFAVSGVVGEIKDANTRATLNVLPFEFKLKEPTSDPIRFINNFARLTGDYSNLSAVDLHLLALTYQLCKENMSADEFAQLKLEPSKIRQPFINSEEFKMEKPINVAGFYLPHRPAKEATDSDERGSRKTSETVANNDTEEHKSEAETESAEKQNESQNSENNEQVEEEDGVEDGEEDDEDTEGWITPANLDEVRKKSAVDAEKQEITNLRLKVACMTSDFSMQNVLLQIGIPVLSVDGLLIKTPRSYALRCITCMKVTTNMSKVFCPHCGYKTLERVVVTVDGEGNKIYRGRRKPASTKGLRFSLPTPRGGKHTNYPIIMEDQPRAQNFPSKKSMVKNNPLDPDYVCQSSPFATRDVYSRAATLGIKSGDANRFLKMNKRTR